jgi:hypothetical protein
MSSVRLWVVVVAACAGNPSPVVRPTPPVERSHALPVTLENGRWFLDTATASGGKLRLFLDSAGGMFVTMAAARRLELDVKRVESEDGERDVVAFPKLADARIPVPEIDPFPVLDDPSFDGDGMLGARGSPSGSGHSTIRRDGSSSATTAICRRSPPSIGSPSGFHATTPESRPRHTAASR